MSVTQSIKISKSLGDFTTLRNRKNSWDFMDVAPTPTPNNTPVDTIEPPPPPAFPPISANDYYLTWDYFRYKCRPSTDMDYVFTESKQQPIAVFKAGDLEWIDPTAHLQHMLGTYDILKQKNEELDRNNRYCLDTLEIMEKKVTQYELLYLKEKVKNYENQFMSSSDEYSSSDDSD